MHKLRDDVKSNHYDIQRNLSEEAEKTKAVSQLTEKRNMSIKISNNSYQSHINLASLHTTRIDRIASSESEFPIQMIHIHEAIIIVMMMPNSKS